MSGYGTIDAETCGLGDGLDATGFWLQPIKIILIKRICSLIPFCFLLKLIY